MGLFAFFGISDPRDDEEDNTYSDGGEYTTARDDDPARALYRLIDAALDADAFTEASDEPLPPSRHERMR
jgi:hypothetical protein